MVQSEGSGSSEEVNGEVANDLRPRRDGEGDAAEESGEREEAARKMEEVAEDDTVLYMTKKQSITLSDAEDKDNDYGKGW